MTGIRSPRQLLTSTPAAGHALARLAQLAVPVTALAVLAAPAAQADTWTRDDATGDTRVTDRNVGDDTMTSGPKSDPSERRGDITRVTARHQDKTVRVAIGVRANAPTSVVTVTVVTSRGDTFRAVYDSMRSSRADRARLVRDGREVACDDLTINPTPSGYLATVPRDCLDTPYRVRVGAQARSYAAGGADDVTREVVDDALRTGRYDRYAPGLSPWIVGSRSSSAR